MQSTPDGFVATARRLAGCAACLVGAACGPTTGSDVGLAKWPPDTCSTQSSPFVQEECLVDLRIACNAQSTQRDCNALVDLPFQNGGYDVQCAWAKVVTFSDAATCSVESAEGRCEASIGCWDGALAEDLSVDPSQSEVVILCGGPLGPWDAIGSTNDEVMGCPASPSAGPSPPLCECADVARQAP